jgi:hypothetical protein
MPGPWEIDEENTCLSVRVSGNIKPGARWRVATVGSVGRSKSDEQNRATAHLIAAAPELYAALDILEWLDVADGVPPFCPICGEDIYHWHNKGCKLHNALKKARGES